MLWAQPSLYLEDDGIADIPKRMGDFLTSLGLPYYSYAIIRAPDDMKFDCAQTLTTNYAGEWLNRYTTNRYLVLDPVVFLAQNTNRPFFWNHGRFLRPFRKAQRQVFNEAREFQINCGLSIPLHSPKGDIGVFNLVADSKSHLMEAVKGAQEQIMTMAYDTHDLMVKSQCRKFLTRQPDIKLSARERECLSWTLDGKTASEIASIIGLSVDTVNHYAKTGTLKMGGSNKFHAAVKALRAGILS